MGGRWRQSVALGCVLSALAAFGCAPAAPTSRPVVVEISRQQEEGYGLLYKLMGDESRVSGIFILKGADQPVKDLVNEIAKTCQDSKTQLDDFARSDSGLHLDVTDLPADEEESREIESKLDERNLLESSGKTFELRLLFTQAQAMGYASNLSRAVANHETDAARKDFLNGLADKCAEYRDRATDMLAVK
jgi:hypothetical protein